MTKQLINLGTSINDGTGDALRTGAQKINDNFNELYNLVGYTLPSATTTTRGGVIVDGLTVNMVNGVLSATIPDAINRLTSGNVVIELSDDGDVTGRLTANGPLIVLAGGNGAENASNNYTQMQWTSDIAHPDTVRSQYLWLDSDGIHFQTLNPTATEFLPQYSNTLKYDWKGVLTLNDAGQVGPVQVANGIDLYASGNMAWTQLNYDNRNFVWATTDSVNIDVLSALPNSSNYRWIFAEDGTTNIPGDLTIASGNIVFGLDQGIRFNDGSTLTTAINSEFDFIIIRGSTDGYQLTINALNQQIANANNTIQDLQSQLLPLESQLEFWQGQPDTIGPGQPNLQKFSAISSLEGQIAYINDQILIIGSQIVDYQNAILFVNEGVDFPQVELRYNALAQQLTIDNGGHSTVKFPNGIVFGDNSTLTTAPNQTLSTTDDVTFNSVTVNSPFRLARFTTEARNLLTAQDGDMIYNTTDHRFQGYQNGVWVDLVTTALDGGLSI